jgi:hypothetical protein
MRFGGLNLEASAGDALTAISGPSEKDLVPGIIYTAENSLDQNLLFVHQYNSRNFVVRESHRSLRLY